MEIISYVNQNSTRGKRQFNKSTISLDELLYRQRRQRKVAQAQLDFSDFTLKLSHLIRDINFCLKKTRFIILGIITVGLVISSVTFVNSKINSVVKPAVFDYALEAEQVIMVNAMRNLVLEEVQDYADDGTLAEASNFVFTNPVTYQEYTVKSGDSISSISKHYGLTNISTLISVNNILNAKALKVGQKLKIPSIDGIIHTVGANETLETIATKYKCELSAILDVNDMTSSVLLKGQRIFIPGKALDQNSLKKALGELFIKPIAGAYRLTSPYGYRADPFTGVRSFHTGVDMAIATGTPILATMDGKIATAGWNNVYGNYVIITHDNGYQTLYAHMQKYIVATGQKVTQGATIGYVGSTGYSTGPHLHFSVYKNSKTIDPMTVLK